MAIFLVASNWIGIACGGFVVFKLAKVAFSKDKK